MRVWFKIGVLLLFSIAVSNTTQATLQEVRQLYQAQSYGLAYKAILSMLEQMEAPGSE